MLTKEQRHAFINGYIGAALFVDVPEVNEDGDFDPVQDAKREQLSLAAVRDLVRTAREMCANPALAPWLDIVRPLLETKGGHPNSPYEIAGYLFWMNRHGHGTGFWELTEDKLGELHPANVGLNLLAKFSRDRWPCYLLRENGVIVPG